MTDNLKDKLLKLKEQLSKAMKQGGIGGQGAVKAGAVLPSIKRVTSAGKAGGNNSTTPSVGITQPSKKNPIKQAEQIQNKDLKDIKMQDAQAQLKSNPLIKFDKNGQWSLNKAEKKSKVLIRKPGESKGITSTKRNDKKAQAEMEAKLKDPNFKLKALMHQQKEANKYAAYDKSVETFDPDHRPPVANKKRTATYIAQFNRRKEAPDKKLINRENKGELKIKKSLIKFDKNGQWSLDKSGYKGYTETDNIKRKENNMPETTGIHTMNSVKRYGGSGPNAATREVAEMRRKSKKNPVKIYSKEEIEAINAERKKQG